MGTEANTKLDRGLFTILPKPPGGVRVFSETHPFQDRWYNNDSPLITWEKDPGVSAFSFILDSQPFTVPENNSMTEDTIKSYESLNDGLWYFHIKALKNGAWGATTHFSIRIDTTPPAAFKPKLDQLSPKTIVSFFTTDNLSGIDHYEIGIMERSKAPTESPAFIQAESSYIVPIILSKKDRVIVRAFDRAGNVREGAVTIGPLPSVQKFIRDYLSLFLAGLLTLIVGLFIIHYLYGHRILAHLRRVVKLMKREERLEKTRKGYKG